MFTCSNDVDVDDEDNTNENVFLLKHSLGYPTRLVSYDWLIRAA